MSECVVRMNLRKNCLDCDLHQIVYEDSYADTDVYCFKEKRLVGKRFGQTKDLARPDWCPIICQLPEGHGRLVFYGEEMESTSLMLTCDPPRYEHRCPKCGNKDYPRRQYPYIAFEWAERSDK